MPKGYLYVGCRWGQLQCVAQDTEVKMAGDAVDGFRQRTALKYVLVCGCGKKFDVWASEFPGKRLMRDCGCGLGDRMQMIPMRISLPIDCVEIIQACQKAEGNKLAGNYIIADLIREGWGARLEQEDK